MTFEILAGGVVLGDLFFFIMILNPTATHALGRAGLRLQIPPWPRRAFPDEDGAVQEKGQE